MPFSESNDLPLFSLVTLGGGGLTVRVEGPAPVLLVFPTVAASSAAEWRDLFFVATPNQVCAPPNPVLLWHSF